MTPEQQALQEVKEALQFYHDNMSITAYRMVATKALRSLPAIEAALNKPKVSLEKCAVGIHTWASKGAIPWEDEDQQFYRMAAKAVLDAAGVDYE